MNTDTFLNLLMSSTIITIVLTEALKKLLNATDTPYRANAVVLDSAMVACTGVGVIYRIPFGLGFEPIQAFRLFALILFTWLVSMVLYDKMVQFIHQHRKVKEFNKDSERGQYKC